MPTRQNGGGNRGKLKQMPNREYLTQTKYCLYATNKMAKRTANVFEGNDYKWTHLSKLRKFEWLLRRVVMLCLHVVLNNVYQGGCGRRCGTAVVVLGRMGLWRAAGQSPAPSYNSMQLTALGHHLFSTWKNIRSKQCEIQSKKVKWSSTIKRV